MANGDNGNGNGQPLWMRIVFVVGPTAAIALYLVWFLTNFTTAMQGDVRLIRENLSLHSQDAQTLGQTIEKYMEVQNMLTRQLCVNAARNEEARAACFKP